MARRRARSGQKHTNATAAGSPMKMSENDEEVEGARASGDGD